MKCSRNFKEIFGVFKIKGNHVFLIENAFYTLKNQEKIDVVKTCQYCAIKEVIEMDKSTLLEVLDLYPNAFDAILREYLLTWKI
jgi:hypothetical protein